MSSAQKAALLTLVLFLLLMPHLAIAQDVEPAIPDPAPSAPESMDGGETDPIVIVDQAAPEPEIAEVPPADVPVTAAPEAQVVVEASDEPTSDPPVIPVPETQAGVAEGGSPSEQTVEPTNMETTPVPTPLPPVASWSGCVQISATNAITPLDVVRFTCGAIPGSDIYGYRGTVSGSSAGWWMRYGEDGMFGDVGGTLPEAPAGTIPALTIDLQPTENVMPGSSISVSLVVEYCVLSDFVCASGAWQPLGSATIQASRVQPPLPTLEAVATNVPTEVSTAEAPVALPTIDVPMQMPAPESAPRACDLAEESTVSATIIDQSASFSTDSRVVSSLLTYEVSASGCSAWSIQMTASDYVSSGPHGDSAIPVVNLMVSSASLSATEGSTDGLVPVQSGTPGTPLTTLSAAKGQGNGTFQHTLHLDLTVPDGTTPNNYQTSVTITANETSAP